MLSVHEFKKVFAAERGDIHAVDRVSFSVSPGEVYGLMGPNGAGKTTTLRMILGLLEPDSGYAEISGFRTSRNVTEVKARIGFVSAGDGVYPWLTAREMLLYFADLYGVEPVDAEPRITDLAELFNVKPLLDRRAGTLSTGERQRINLLRGLVHDPPVMLLDEPTRGLDVVGSQAIFDYICHLREVGKAVVVCTHRLEEAERMCDRFGLLHQGRLRYEGTFAQLVAASGKTSLVEIFVNLLNEETSRER